MEPRRNNLKYKALHRAFYFFTDFTAPIIDNRITRKRRIEMLLVILNVALIIVAIWTIHRSLTLIGACIQELKSMVKYR